jgi:hypothetical protein
MIAPLAEQVRSEVVNNAPSMIASSVALCLSNMAGISPHWSALNSSHSEPCFAFVSNRPRAGLSEPGSPPENHYQRLADLVHGGNHVSLPRLKERAG